MTDLIDDEPGEEPVPAPQSARRDDAPQGGVQSSRRGRSRRLALWGAAALAAVAAAVAVFAPAAAGPSGIVLLSGIAAAGLLLLYALAAGDAAGRILSPDDADIEDASRASRSAAHAFEAITDPSLIVDRHGSPRLANAAYRELSRETGALGDSGRPAGFDRVFGQHPGVSSAIFRLAKAAKAKAPRLERMGAAPFGVEGRPRAFDLEVAAMPGGESLWRARERGGAPEPGEDGAGADTLLDDAPIGFFSAAPDGRVLVMNETLKKWLGRTGSDKDLSVKDFITGDAVRALGKARRAGAPAARAEVVLKARDGIETSAVVVTAWPQTEGKPSSRSVVFGLTATGAPPGVAQALAAPTAGELGSLLDAMFANAPFGVARLEGPDPLHAIIEDANPALLDLTHGGATPGRQFADIFELDEASARALEDATTSAAEPIELELKERGGEQASGQMIAKIADKRVVHVYFAPASSGRKAAYIIDVSTQKKFERQFLQAQKMRAIGDLAGGVSHDINNFLTTIRLSADNLLEVHTVGDPSYKPLQTINSMVARGAGLVRMLLAFARGQTMQAELCDLSASLAEFGTLLRHFLEETVKLDITHGRDLPYVKVDIGQLEAAILNLATNARDAMRSQGGGTLSLKTYVDTHETLVARGAEDAAEGRYAVIEVKDTGSGMNAATLEKIFQPFFTTKGVGEGTGLGLAMVFGIVKQSGGHILVDSKVGEGTTFRIFLPAYEPTAKELADMAEEVRVANDTKPRDHSGGGLILFVEDEVEVRTLAAKILRRRGYDVEEASDGEEALEILAARPGEFDLLITDVMMPEMDGPTLLRRGREHLGDASVVFISGYAKEQFSELLSSEREVSFLSKPFTTKQLSERVKEVLG